MYYNIDDYVYCPRVCANVTIRSRCPLSSTGVSVNGSEVYSPNCVLVLSVRVPLSTGEGERGVTECGVDCAVTGKKR